MDWIRATGRRKNSVAQVRLIKGKGKIIVNNLPMNQYFRRATDIMIINKPLEITDSLKSFDIYVTVKGGVVSLDDSTIAKIRGGQ